MSQFIIPIDEKTKAQVGWDPALQTYYGQVYRINEAGERMDIFLEDGEEKDGTIFWVGTEINAVRTVEQLQLLLQGRVTIPSDVRAELEVRQEGEPNNAHLGRHLVRRLRIRAGVYGTPSST